LRDRKIFSGSEGLEAAGVEFAEADEGWKVGADAGEGAVDVLGEACWTAGDRSSTLDSDGVVLAGASSSELSRDRFARLGPDS
jgi:hypothetical protein